MAALVTAVVAGGTGSVSAIDYGTQIQNLKNQNSSDQSSRGQLQSDAATLQDQIQALQNTIDSINTQIANNQARQADLKQQISDTQAKITDRENILAGSVRDLYINHNMSMLEIMASSKDLSDYVDQEQYTTAAQSNVEKQVSKINTLKKQEEGQKKQVDGLLADNQSMQKQASDQKDQVNKLLAMNQSQQSQYAAAITATTAKITQLEQEQAQVNAQYLSEQQAAASAVQKKAAASGTPVTQAAAPSGISPVDGSQYPYAGAPWPNEIADPWGMYERQCVSFTAWAVSASGRHMPYWGGSGDAKQWPGNARSAGIPVDGNPRPGDVAIRTSGTYGHAMYVNAVNSDGTIQISQYNADWNGTYSTATITTSGLDFIHFP